MSATTVALANRANVNLRHHGASSPQYIDARREHAAAAIEQAVEHYLTAAPPLSDEQVERIAARLRGVDPSGADA